MRLISKIKQNGGYTLSELIIYMALFSIIATGVIGLLVSVLYSKMTIDTTNKYTQEARIIADTIAKEMRNSFDYEILEEESKINLCKNELCTETSSIYVLNGTAYITRENGSNAPISSSDIKIQELKFEDYTSVKSRNLIHFKLHIKNLDSQKYPPAKNDLIISTAVNFRNGLQD